MKKNIKIITLIILISILTIIPSAKSFASSADIGGIVNNAGGFIDAGKNPGNKVIVVDPASTKGVSDLLYNVLLAVGIIIMVIWGMVLGIKFIAGAAEEKAEIKKALVPYFVGVIIVLSAFSIWKIVVNVLQPFA